ncbi:MAG: TIGR02186 family protein [Parasphingorhabdus sp.]|nr:TIGR02186 family protein [Parasphingorhabdus sp.]
MTVPLWRIAAIFGLLAVSAASPVLVPDVSQDRVQIRGDFTGAELLLFGAISYPPNTPDRDTADIVIVLKGPDSSIVVREKQRVAGIWVNADSSEFRSAPGFFAVASTRPIDNVVDPKTADIYELGINHLQLSPASAIDSGELKRFEAGLVDLNERSRRYISLPGAVTITDDLLYKARIALPASVPVGTYTAETFLVIKKRVVAAETKKIIIEKIGMGRFITNMAKDHGFIYGLLAVALSVGLGWAAGTLFRRI